MTEQHAPRFTVREHRRWRNTATGATASIYGANPYWGADPGAWIVESAGFTIADSHTGTVGCGRPPSATREDAQALADTFNARFTRPR